MYQEINTQALLYNRCGMVDDEINTLKVLLPMCKVSLSVFSRVPLCKEPSRRPTLRSTACLREVLSHTLDHMIHNRNRSPNKHERQPPLSLCLCRLHHYGTVFAAARPGQ